MSRPKYALHPGWVTSKKDGEDHYIGVALLERLYELRSNEYIVWRDRGFDAEEYIHLYPRYDGKYGRPSN